MKRAEVEELLRCLELLGGLCEDLTQRVVAVENAFQSPDRQRYEKELKKLKERGGLTNAAIALEALRTKLLPNQ